MHGVEGGIHPQDSCVPAKPKCKWAYNGCVMIKWAFDDLVEVNPGDFEVPEHAKCAPWAYMVSAVNDSGPWPWVER